MTYEMLIELGGFITMMIAIVNPLMKLNTNIAKLDNTFISTVSKIEDVKKMTDAQELRLQNCEQKIIKIETELEDYERRIAKLEK